MLSNDNFGFLNSFYRINSLAKLGRFTALLFATLLGLSACGVEDGLQLVDQTLPANGPLQLDNCPDAGIGTSTCVLSDPNNPFRYVDVSDTTKWVFNKDTDNKDTNLSNKAKFYMWATAMAKNPTGENQFYTADALQQLYAALKTSSTDAPVAQSQAKKAYHSLLSNYYDSTTEALQGSTSAPIDFIPDTDFTYDNWGSTVYDDTHFNGNYTDDDGYTPVWKVQRASTGWGAAVAFAFTPASVFSAEKFNTLQFKIKSTDNSPFKVKFAGGGTANEKEITIDLPATATQTTAGVTVTAIQGKTGWNQVTINLATVFPSRSNNNAFGIFENDTSFTVGNALYMTDIGFSGDADASEAGLYKDVNGDGYSYLYRSTEASATPVYVTTPLRNWVGANLIDALGNRQLYADQAAATAQLTAWGYNYTDGVLSR